ncbi:cytoplasmic membrane protein [Thecamonas trahens ATCC 50062]|uniref:Cytoplasmic membrane protein n=1 Tax=Thecamonas trahens ATCC 50062 TaxID=461836 RepID=A0A0L0DJ56_THETB|nr:cytoplasmic membrane protein [Thecamonas trahens ATCC 50062]KNC52096.1 cytoplasmic membrane protein [Thecamonas trahens ATCC 50062]|eukprot:XP_013762101.1 cytoplasmic membrane protein [Thecamonas trahens ATCC 50062]
MRKSRAPAESGKAKELVLANKNLHVLPVRETLRSDVVALDLRENFLIALPEAIGNMSGLVALTVALNRLSALPAAVCSLASLTFLDVSYNAITVLPPAIGALGALVQLNVQGNALADLPSSLAACTRLELLNLNKNAFVALPAPIAHLASLTHLDASDNALVTCAGSLAAGLTSLTSLDLADNALAVFPPEILSLTQLAVLNLERNRIVSLPTEYAAFDAAATAIEDEVLFNGNPLADPPKKILWDSMIGKYMAHPVHAAVSHLAAAEAGLRLGTSDDPELASLARLPLDLRLVVYAWSVAAAAAEATTPLGDDDDDDAPPPPIPEGVSASAVDHVARICAPELFPWQLFTQRVALETALIAYKRAAPEPGSAGDAPGASEADGPGSVA